MRGDLTVTVTEPERAQEWQAWIDTMTVPVEDPFVRQADFPRVGRQDYFVLDRVWLERSDARKDRLAEGIAEKFGLPKEDVLNDMHVFGVPILAKDCQPNFEPIRSYPSIPLRLLL